jgi:uncharacterized integral membrane protein
VPVFLVLLVAYLVALGLFAVQNADARPVHLGVWTWYEVPAGIPVAIGAGGVLALMLLWGAYSRLRSGVQRRSLTRQINAHEASVSGLRAENDDLRSELARLRGQLEAVRGSSNGAVHAESALPPAAGS